MNYKSFSDLSKDIKSNLHKIPKDVSLVVGIPRSGLLAANLMAIYLNLPLTDIDSFIKGQILSSCFRADGFEDNAFKGKILIVDDSVATGKAIVDAKEKLADIIAQQQFQLLFCCVYADPEKQHLVDIPLLTLGRPRVFEWNLFHNKVMEKACVDIDGVLCIDPTEEENDDGEKYLEFLLNANPHILPKRKINTLVTTRLEKYRSNTEDWLKRHGIEYNELVMLNLPDKATRKKMNNRGAYKAAEFKKRKNNVLFIESDRRQALKIHELSGKDVYCVDTNEMFSGNTNRFSRVLLNNSRRLYKKFRKVLKSFF